MGRLRSIVLVESNALDALTIRCAFEQVGQKWSLVHCVDSVGALTYLQRPKEELPCLIILDLDNGREDNLALLRFLQKDHPQHPIPILMLASGAHNGAVAEYQNLGVDDYLIKPTDYELFTKEVVFYLNRWTAQRMSAA